MSRCKFSDARYEEIKKEVLFMFEESGIDTYPIDPFVIAKRLNYRIIPYSTLTAEDYLAAVFTSNEGYSHVEQRSDGMFEYAIYYNDDGRVSGNIRWTIFHELGHITLGHHDNAPGNEQNEEDEADFFAKYAIAPPPLINATKCEDAFDICMTFKASETAANYIYEYFMKWKKYGPSNYLPYEKELLGLFHIAAI